MGHHLTPNAEGRDLHNDFHPRLPGSLGRQATGEATFDVGRGPLGPAQPGRHGEPADRRPVEEAGGRPRTPLRDEFAATPAHTRAAALDHVSRRLVERTRGDRPPDLPPRTGKPIKWARGEVGRAVSIFRFAAGEARRFNGGEAQRLDATPAARAASPSPAASPRAPSSASRPSTSPSTCAPTRSPRDRGRRADHLLKPAPATLSGLILGDLLAETQLPAGSWSILPVPNDKMPALVRDERLPVISFTGSETVGYAIMDSVPRKHCTLELGGIGAAVVLGDWASGEDLDWAATRIATFSNYQGGQSCISPCSA